MLKEEWWTFEEVERRLIDAADVHRQLTRTGSNPFATDGPWYLAARELYGPDVDNDVPVRRPPPSRQAIADMQEAVEWLLLVKDRDRRLVMLAVNDQARSGRRPDWKRMMRRLGMVRGSEGLRKRYDRAVAAIAMALNSRSQIDRLPQRVTVSSRVIHAGCK